MASLQGYFDVESIDNENIDLQFLSCKLLQVDAIDNYYLI